MAHRSNFSAARMMRNRTPGVYTPMEAFAISKSEDASKTIDLEALHARLSQPMSVEAYYEHLASVGADYGPSFRGIQEVWRTDGEALGRITIPETF